MIRLVKSRRSDLKVLCDKMIADNWWGTYHDTSVFSWSYSPKCYDSDGKPVPYWKECLPEGKANIVNDAAKTMVCVDRQRDIIVMLVRE